MLEVVPRYLITGRRVAGASFGGAKGRDRVPELVDRYLAGDLDLESLVTNRVTLDQVNDAFEAMERQEGIRTVITYG
jgi:S-(hydroxymethyl)glutathione dehydrogenase / alcohol dehydrogenase